MNDTVGEVKSMNVFKVMMGAPSEYRPKPTEFMGLLKNDKDIAHLSAIIRRLRGENQTKENLKIIRECEDKLLSLVRSLAKKLMKSTLFNWRGVDKATVERIFL